MKVVSPFTGKECSHVISEIAVYKIKKLYKRKMKVDVSSDFETDSIFLIKDDVTDIEFFYPFKAGSVQFYIDLYSNWPYEILKNEYSYSQAFINENQSILDIGCGQGNFSDFTKSARFTGLELNPESVERGVAKKRNILMETIQNHSLENIEKYDIVTSFQVLEHVDCPMEFISSALKCLKPQGYLILSVPNNHGYKFDEINSFSNIPPHHLSRWSLKSFLWLSSRFNLKLVDYNQDKETLRNYIRFTVLQNLSKLFGSNEKKIIILSPLYRIFDICLNVSLHILKPLLKTDNPSISGHSITVVLQKSDTKNV